jgi:hypothetical protein
MMFLHRRILALLTLLVNLRYVVSLEVSDEEAKELTGEQLHQLQQLEKMMGGMSSIGDAMGKMTEAFGGPNPFKPEADPDSEDALKEFESTMAQLKGEAPVGADPTAKEIDSKSARKFMKEVLTTLSTKGTKKKLDEAFGAAYSSGSLAVMMRVGPVMEKALAGIVEKYSFEGGLPQALFSVEEARKKSDDPKLNAALDKFHSLTGVKAGEYKYQAPLEADENEGDRDMIRAFSDKLRAAQHEL